PTIAVVGAMAEGDTEIRDAHELRVKETDRIAAMATNLRAFGVTVTEHDDGMTIHGGSKPVGARVDSLGDHRIAMAFAILGLFAAQDTETTEIVLRASFNTKEPPLPPLPEMFLKPVFPKEPRPCRRCLRR